MKKSVVVKKNTADDPRARAAIAEAENARAAVEERRAAISAARAKMARAVRAATNRAEMLAALDEWEAFAEAEWEVRAAVIDEGKAGRLPEQQARASLRQKDVSPATRPSAAVGGAPDLLPPLHPGEVLREEYMVPLRLTAYALAQRLGVPRTRVERIAREEKGITADTALRLGAYFRTTPEFWLNLQTKYELETRLRDRKVAREIHKIEEMTAA